MKKIPKLESGTAILFNPKERSIFKESILRASSLQKEGSVFFFRSSSVEIRFLHRGELTREDKKRALVLSILSSCFDELNIKIYFLEGSQVDFMLKLYVDMLKEELRKYECYLEIDFDRKKYLELDEGDFMPMVYVAYDAKLFSITKRTNQNARNN